MNTKTVPQGYRQNAVGNLIATENIKALDLIEDELVQKIVEQAVDLQQEMMAFKQVCLEQMDQFIDLAAEEYGAKRQGKEGNLTLRTFDGSHSISIKVQKTMAFDSKLDVAKLLVDECIIEWAKDARPEIKTLIEAAFQTDKRGNINREKLFDLLRLDISDPKWKKAMEALKDSIFHDSSKTYFVITRRESGQNKRVQLPMNLSSL